MANIESYFPVAYSVQHDSFADLCFTTYFHYSNHTESASTVENSNSTIELPCEEFWCVWFPNFSSSCLAQIESESKAFKNITTAAMKIIRLIYNVVSISLHIMDKTIMAATRYTEVLSIRYMFLMQLTKPLKTLAPELPIELSHRSSSSKLCG